MLQSLLAEGRRGVSLQMCLASTWHRTMFMTTPSKLHQADISGTRPDNRNHNVHDALLSISCTFPVLVGKFRH